MSESLEQVEQRFIALRTKTPREQWLDAHWLHQKAKALLDSDLPLAHRILARARNLAPDNIEIQEAYSSSRLSVAQQYPELMSTKSRVSTQMKHGVESSWGLILDKLKEQSQKQLPFWKRASLYVVILPTLVFWLYLFLIASPRYESNAQVILKQPDGMATMDASMALLTGLGVPSTGLDIKLVEAYISSADMLTYLQQQTDLRAHYTNSEHDYFSRLSTNASFDDFLEFYQSHISVEVDEKTQVLQLNTQGFAQAFAKTLNKAVLERAEWFINDIGHQMANAQLSFMKQEHQNIEARLSKAKQNLRQFQEQHNLLDPESEGMAFQRITYELEAQISAKQAELNGLLQFMTQSAPRVVAVKNEISALTKQMEKERARLAEKSSPAAKVNGVTNTPVGEVLARFSDLKIEMELALQAYTSSLVSLEKSRIEAFRQLQYLVTVQQSTLPEEHRYPRVFYNTSVLFVVLLLLYGIGRIVLATIRELN